MDEFMAGAYELLILNGWVEFWPEPQQDEDVRSVELTHPEHCPHDPVDVHLAFAIMFAAAGAVHRDRTKAA